MFVTLAQTGSFTLTAKQLFLSQSAVSHSLKALEEAVGCRLFDRLGKKISLTQAGEQLLGHAEKILQEMQLAQTSLEQLGKWGKPRLRLGASLTACQYLLPTALRKFKEQYAECIIRIGSADTSESLDRLLNNEIDLALVLEPEVGQRLEFHPLFMDEMCFVTDPSHEWARQNSVVRSDIGRQSYILYHKSSYTFRLVERYFRDEDIVLNTVIEVASMDAIKELVKLGLGVSVLAPWIAQRELLEKSLISLPLGRRKLTRTWGIAHRPGYRLSIAEVTFLQICKSTAAQMLGSRPSA